MAQAEFLNKENSVSFFQQARRQKHTEEEKRPIAPSAVCDEESSSGFTDIPLSLPYQHPEEKPKDPVQPLEATAQSSDLSSEKQQNFLSQPLSTSVLTNILQSTLNLSTESLEATENLTESKNYEEEHCGVAAAQGAEPIVAPVLQSWNYPTQLEIRNAPTAPALYPSLPTLEEGSVIQLSQEAVKNGAKGPAVLALPEQESSPLSFQPLESVAELSRSKLYPELNQKAPEIQVILLTKRKHKVE